VAANFAVFAAHVGHSDCGLQGRRKRGARDVPGFFSFAVKALPPAGVPCIKFHQHTHAIYLAARAHALHNLLSGIAALGVADVRMLQSGFVWNLLIAKIVAEPWDALFQSQSTQCLVSIALPPAFSTSARSVSHRRGKSSRAARNSAHAMPPGERLVSPHEIPVTELSWNDKSLKLTRSMDVNFLTRSAACGPSSASVPKRVRFIAERDVIHDDEFVQRRHQPFPDQRVRDAKQALRGRVSFDLGLNSSLRIQK